MSQFEFPSLESESLPKAQRFAYRFKSDYWHESKHGEYLSDHLSYFLTYGDGMTQHAHSDLVQKDRFSDCLMSLAVFLAANPDLVEVVAGGWPGETWVPEIQFALSVKFKEGKRQFYSKNERKVSTSETKKYDKRWEEVPTWADGTGESAFRLMSPDWFDGFLKRWYRYDEIQRYCGQHADLYGGKMPGRFFDLQSDWAESAFQAVDCLVEGWRKADHGRYIVKRYQERIEREKEATQVEEAEATPAA